MGFLQPYLKRRFYLLNKVLLWFKSKRTWDPVPDYCRVIRLSRIPKGFEKNQRVLAIQLGDTKAFELSSLDKKSAPPHLSVWVDLLTTPEQAYSFLPNNSPCRLVLRLQVEEIRKIIGRTESNSVHPNLLNVIWVNLTENMNSPGSKGHSGIIGLDDKSVPSKLLRKDLRAQLAELASKDCYLLSDTD